MSDGSAVGQARYKQARNWFWLGFTVVWSGGWYLLLDSTIGAQGRAQDAACVQAGRWLCGGNATASSIFVWICVILSVIASPLMLLPARYAARRYTSHVIATENRREAEEEAALRQQQQAESQRRIALSEAEATAAREKSSRSEIIMKLGSINDLVDVMAVENDQGRLVNIRLGVAQALRELAAKYDGAALGALIQADEATRVTVRSVISRLEGSSLADLVELELLRRAADEQAGPEQALQVG